MTVKTLTHTQESVLKLISDISAKDILFFGLVDDKIFKIQTVNFFDDNGSCVASNGNVFKFEHVKLTRLILINIHV